MAKSKIQESSCRDPDTGLKDWPPNLQFFTISGYPKLDVFYREDEDYLSSFAVLKTYCAGTPGPDSPLSDAKENEPYGNINNVLTTENLIYLSIPGGEKRHTKRITLLQSYLDSWKSSYSNITSTTDAGSDQPPPNDGLIISARRGRAPKKYTLLDTLFKDAGAQELISTSERYESLTETELDGSVSFVCNNKHIIDYKLNKIPIGALSTIDIEPLPFSIALKFSLYVKFSINLKFDIKCKDQQYRPITVPLHDNNQDLNVYFVKVDTIPITYLVESSDTYTLERDGQNYKSIGSPISNLFITETISGTNNTVYMINPDTFQIYTKDFEIADGQEEPKAQVKDPLAAIDSTSKNALLSTVVKIINEKLDKLFKDPEVTFGEQMRKYGLSDDTDLDCITGCLYELEAAAVYKVCCDTFDTELDYGKPVSQLKEEGFIIDLVEIQ